MPSSKLQPHRSEGIGSVENPARGDAARPRGEDRAQAFQQPPIRVPLRREPSARGGQGGAQNGHQSQQWRVQSILPVPARGIGERVGPLAARTSSGLFLYCLACSPVCTFLAPSSPLLVCHHVFQTDARCSNPPGVVLFVVQRKDPSALRIEDGAVFFVQTASLGRSA